MQQFTKEPRARKYVKKVLVFIIRKKIPKQLLNTGLVSLKYALKK